MFTELLEKLFEPASEDEQKKRQEGLSDEEKADINFEKHMDYINLHAQAAVQYDPEVLDDIAEATHGDSAVNVLLERLDLHAENDTVEAVYNVVKDAIERRDRKQQGRL